MKKKNRRKGRIILDAVVAVFTIALFFACKFLWECEWDYRMTIFGIVVVFCGTVLLEMQDRRIDK